MFLSRVFLVSSSSSLWLDLESQRSQPTPNLFLSHTHAHTRKTNPLTKQYPTLPRGGYSRLLSYSLAIDICKVNFLECSRRTMLDVGSHDISNVFMQNPQTPHTHTHTHTHTHRKGGTDGGGYVDLRVRSGGNVFAGPPLGR
jgi:hypothetical protein